MPILPLKKITLLAMKENRDRVLQAFQEYGEIHIDSCDESCGYNNLVYKKDSQKLEDMHLDIDNITSAINNLKRYDERKKPMLVPKPELSYSEFEKITADKSKVFNIVEQSTELVERHNEINTELIRLDSSENLIFPWHNLMYKASDIEDTNNVRIVAGTISTLEYQYFAQGLNEFELWELEKIYTDREFVYILLIYHNEVNEQLIELLGNHDFSKAEFSFEGLAKDNIQSIRDERKRLNKEHEDIDKKQEELSRNLDILEKLYDALSIQMNKFEQIEKFGGTKYVFVIDGWIPEHEEERFKKLVRDTLGKDHELIIEQVEQDNENKPTLYENRALIRPFESVTNMFSTPKSNSADPNIAMAPFFAILFGMMMSDAGYGLVLALAAGIIYYKTKPSRGSGNGLLGVIAISGVLTIFWGFMYGGFMGMSIKPVLFNPMEEPMLTLGLCLLMGVIHIITGMVVRAIILIKRKQVMQAISQQFTWIALIIGLVIFAFPVLHTFVSKVPSDFVVAMGKVGMYIMILGLAGIIVLGGYGKKGISRIMGGVSSLTEITSYLSDILSYARLFGLGLATGVIGMVINMMVGMLTGSILGWIAAIVIFIGAHAFNIGINALGAYVHSSRLQYVEFFGKFFEDGGIPFRRFAPKTKYYNIK